MASDTTPSTVELPANQKIKQLAHDVEREGNEYAVPLLHDFYQFLSILDEEQSVTWDRIHIDKSNQMSELSPKEWGNLLNSMHNAGILDKEVNTPNRYTLAVEE